MLATGGLKYVVDEYFISELLMSFSLGVVLIIYGSGDALTLQSQCGASDIPLRKKLSRILRKHNNIFRHKKSPSFYEYVQKILIKNPWTIVVISSQHVC